MLGGELLEEIADTLEDAKAAPNTSFEPQGVVESRAITAVFCVVEKFKKRLKEFLRELLTWSKLGSLNFFGLASGKQVPRCGKWYYLPPQGPGK